MPVEYRDYPAHFCERNLLSFRKSRVIPSRKEPKKAIVFIHGYWGDVDETWFQFQYLLPKLVSDENYDIFFYNYDGRFGEFESEGQKFLKFLHALANRPYEVLDGALQMGDVRFPDARYERLIVVAHSLGAVITRIALLKAVAHTTKDPTYRMEHLVKLVLFAPAHKGARVQEPIYVATSTKFLLAAVAALIRVRSPYIKQLEEGSPELTWLEATTVKYLNDGSPHLRAISVSIADPDLVVSNIPFAEDPPSTVILNTSHTSLCKPAEHFLEPLDRVVAEL